MAQGDQWLQQRLSSYARWARANNSLLVLTWDEDDGSQYNQVPTIITGARVKPGRYSELLTDYRLLRTIEYLCSLAPLGAAATTRPLTAIWAHGKTDMAIWRPSTGVWYVRGRSGFGRARLGTSRFRVTTTVTARPIWRSGGTRPGVEE